MDSLQAQQPKGQIRPIRPSIIIGLGGTGQRILMNVRKRIVEAYGDLASLPIVGFLVLDTDSERPIMPNIDEAFLQKINLAPAEFIHASVTGTQKLKEEIRRYSELSEWLDRRILELGDVTVGAKGIRAVGRLAFFLNYSRIKTAFNTLRTKVADKSNLDYMLNTHGIQVDPGLNVYVISSACGGTGSGMFLDLAFMVKSLLEGTENTRVGYLIMPGVFGTDMTYGAGYATLRELNHYSLSHDFEANWEKERVPKKIQPPPFNFCYLINNKNSRITFAHSDDLFEMVAHNIYLEFAHEFGQYKTSLKDNVSAMAGGTDRLGCPLNFMGLGLASIYFPKERVINTCAFRLARKVVERWLSTVGFSDRMDEYLTHYMELNRLYVDVDAARKNLLRDVLLLAEGSKTYYGKVDEELQASLKGLQNQDLAKFDSYLERREEDFLKKFYDGDKDPERWGEFFRGIYHNKEKKIKEIQEQVQNDISAMIGKESEGLGFAKQFLEAMDSQINRYRDYFMKKFDELSKLETGLVQARTREIEALKKMKTQILLSKRDVMLEHAEKKLLDAGAGAYANLYKRKIDKKALEMLLDFSIRFSEFLRKLVLEIDNFKTKMERILRSLQETERNLIYDTAGLVVNGDLLYDPKDIDRYYGQFIDEQDKARDRDSVMLLGNAALSVLGCPALFDLRKDDYREKDLRDALVEQAKPFFEGVNEISVARKFLDKYPSEIQALSALRNIFSSAEVFLTFKQIPDFVRLPNSKVSLIGIFGGRSSPLTDFKEMIPLLEKCCAEPGQLRGIQPLRSKNEILFTTEEGAFPLRMINDIDQYEAKYDQLSEGLQNPLHLRKDEQDYLVEITPPSVEEQRQAKMSVLIGLALGVITPDNDDPQRLVYSYIDPRTGLREYKPLGKTGNEEKIIDSLLARFNKNLREILYRNVTQKLTVCARDVKEKEIVWRKIVEYRDNLFRRRDKEYIEKQGYAEIFQSTIIDYNLYDPSFSGVS